MTSLIVPSPRWRILKTIDIGKNIPDFCHQFIHVRACITRSQDGWVVSAYSTCTPYIHTRCYLFLDVLYELLKVFLTIWPTLLHKSMGWMLRCHNFDPRKCQWCSNARKYLYAKILAFQVFLLKIRWGATLHPSWNTVKWILFINYTVIRMLYMPGTCNGRISRCCHVESSFTCLLWEGSTGMCRPQDPFFRPFASSGDPVTHHFKPFSSSRDPTSVFWKNFAFSSSNFCQFWLNFSSWDTNFSAETPVSSQKSVLETLLWKPLPLKTSYTPSLV